VTVKPNGAQNLMLDEPAFRTRTAASIAEIESLRTTLLIEIAGTAELALYFPARHGAFVDKSGH
jgi:hypothetical protein